MKSNKVFCAVLMGVMMFSVGCAGEAKEALYKDGVFEGVGEGLQGDIKVSVTVANGKISKVEVMEHQESPGVSDPAIEKIPAAILEKQSAEVDTVSGVTYTSDGIKEAVEKALSQAK